MKRFAAFAVLLVFSVLGFSFISSTSASAADLTWTGGGDGTTTNDQANWTPTQSPAAGDTLIFPALSSTPTKQITFNTAPVLGYVYFHRDQSIGKTDYVINGSVSARNIIADSDAKVSFTGNVAFMQHAGAPTTPYQISAEGDSSLTFSSPILTLGSGSGTALTIGGDGDVTMNPGIVAQASTVTAINIEGSGVLLSGQLSQMGHATLTVKQNSKVSVENLAWLGEYTILETNAGVGLPIGSQVSSKFVLHEGSSIYGTTRDPAGDIVFTESSRLALMGNARYKSEFNNVNLVIKGDICNVTLDINCNNTSTGKFKITPTDDSYGAVIVAQAAGKENASEMVNGQTVEPPYQTEVISGNDGNINVRPYKIVVVNGSVGKVIVFDKGVLKGTGTIGELEVQPGGRVAPGQSPGILNVGNTVFSSGSSFEAEIGGTKVGTEYDQLKVTGTINLGDSTLDAKLINDFKPKAGDVFTIIDNDGTDAVTGTFKDLAEGSTVTVGETTFKVSYVGGDGNDVTLTVPGSVAVPGTPNTGFGLLAANPLATLMGSLASAGTLFVMARKYSLFSK